jgi:hypothetical protein
VDQPVLVFEQLSVIIQHTLHVPAEQQIAAAGTAGHPAHLALAQDAT